jgi:hypothetical protein
MKDNHIALLLIAFGVGAVLVLGPSQVSIMAATAVTACAFSALMAWGKGVF